MITAYVKKLREEAAAQALEASQPALTERVIAALGGSDTARIPELQRALDADPRAIGEALRGLGYKRRRVWSGEDYALTQWERSG